MNNPTFSANTNLAHYRIISNGDYRWLDGDGMGGRNFDARTGFFYVATVNKTSPENRK